MGRKVRAFTAAELPDEEKLPTLRGYLQKRGWKVKQNCDSVTAESTDEEIIAARPDHPVFRITVKS